MVTQIAQRYDLLEELGSGGIGTVHRAIDRLTGETVALKRLNFSADLLASVEENLRREVLLSIATEFRLMASARHPNVAAVYDYGFDDTAGALAPYMTVELIEQSQDIVIAAASTDREQRIDMLLQLLDALAYLHQRGIIHHDLKPANVLVRWQDGQPIVKVLDFGLSSDTLTRPELSGTVAYTAPEMLLDDASPPTRQSDLYSAGVILYEVLAGQPLFESTPSSFTDIINRITQGDYDLNAVDDLAAVRDVVGRLLATDPSARYPTAHAARMAFSEAAGYPLPPASPQVMESYLQASRFVGRDAELAHLLDELSLAYNGEGRALLITGESGIGKSRLIDELRIQALTRGFLVLQGQATEEGSRPYQLWRGAIPPLVLRSNLSTFSAGVLKDLVPHIESLLGHPVPDAQEVTAVVAQLRLADQVVALFQQQTQPILLILRDLHWASESLSILRALTDVAANLPLYIVGSFRTDEGHNLPAELRDLPQIPLQRLSDASVTELTSYILGDAGHDERVVQFLQRESEGNVFFLIEVARALAENAGSLTRITGDALPENVLPGGVVAAIQRRLDRIPEAYQPVLKLAAVAGRTIDEALLGYYHTETERFTGVCAQLSILEVQDGRWRFTHDKIRETLLDTLPADERRTLNQRVAEAIEAIYPDEKRHLPLLEFWTAADNGDDLYCHKISDYAWLAGKDALAVGSLRDALRLAERGLEREPTTDDRMHLLKLAADAYRALSDYVHASPRYEQSMELAREQHNRAFEAETLIGLGRTAGNQGAYNAARIYYSTALDIYRDLEQRAGIAECLNNLGTVAARQGDFDAADRYHNECLGIYRAINHQSGIAGSLYGLGEVAKARGDLSTAVQCFTDSQEIRAAVGDRKGVARNLNELAQIYIQQGDLDHAKRTLQRTFEMRQTMGDRKGVAASLQNLGWIARLENKPQTAYQQISQALEIQRNISYRYGQAISMTYLAEICVMQDDLSGCRDYLRDALVTVQSIGAKSTLMDTLCVTVDYLHRMDDMALAGQVTGMLLAQYPDADETLRERLHPFLDALDRYLTPTRARSQLESGASRNPDALISQVLDALK